eukprot:Unigene11303_Nuclearia_a/m.34535 Unigene11303_Nuclearia_a/g.34535  ORF Unigene11303_Nuclearia_a/g.34535 Unigene11303_Nuclearia_a/m.34535 type:complete len:696 (-) Unigene11303_Nuclearia_a:81-2168(-)
MDAAKLRRTLRLGSQPASPPASTTLAPLSPAATAAAAARLLQDGTAAQARGDHQAARRSFTDGLALGDAATTSELLLRRAGCLLALGMHAAAIDDAVRAAQHPLLAAEAHHIRTIALTRLDAWNDAFAGLRDLGDALLGSLTLQQDLLAILQARVLANTALSDADVPARDCAAFECAVCQHVLHDPVTTACGHSACRQCMSELASPTTCPQCRHALTAPPPHNYVLAHIVQKALPSCARARAALRHADEAADSGQTDAALQALQALTASPVAQLAWQRQCEFLLARGDHSGACDAARHACEAAPRSGRGQQLLACVLLQAGQPHKALCFALESCRLQPLLATSLDILARSVVSCARETPTLALDDVAQLFASARDELARLMVDRPAADTPVAEAFTNELDCHLCLSLLVEPVTTACGHTFCRLCLDKVMDRNARCPVCRTPIARRATALALDVTVDALARTYFAPAYADRLAAMHYAAALETTDVPIFVCALAFPRVPCPLHIFEPRYKLMMQRCLAMERPRFGMCLPTGMGTYADVGVMLDIRDVQELPNGNLLVDTIGTRRFRVLERGVRDRYNIANIAFIDDEDDDGLPDEHGVTSREYMQTGLDFYRAMYEQLPPDARRRFSVVYGEAPAELSVFSFWLLAFIPTDDEIEKLELVRLTVPKERLRRLAQMVETLQRAQEAAPSTRGGCVIS